MKLLELLEIHRLKFSKDERFESTIRLLINNSKWRSETFKAIIDLLMSKIDFEHVDGFMNLKIVNFLMVKIIFIMNFGM